MARLKQMINNFRLMFTLGVLSKIFEKFMCKRLHNYLRSRYILMKIQYGLGENSNTEYAILKFMDYSYDAIRNSDCLLATFVNLSKTFDSVKHNIL